MPSALALIAALNALIISPTSAFVDPVHVYATSNELGRVRGAVLRRHEERVRGHVVDERELPLRVLGNTVPADPSDAPSAASAPKRAGSETAAPPTLIRRSSAARSMPPDSRETTSSSQCTNLDLLLTRGGGLAPRRGGSAKTGMRAQVAHRPLRAARRGAVQHKLGPSYTTSVCTMQAYAVGTATVCRSMFQIRLRPVRLSHRIS